VVRRHHVERHRPRLLRHAGVLASRQPTMDEICGALHRPRRWGDPARSRGVENTSSVCHCHHRHHAGLPGQPGGQLAQRRFVDAQVAGEGAGDRGDDPAVVLDRGHFQVSFAERS
jgi:hypothetical protein